LKIARGAASESFPGLDDIAERLAEEYPGPFAGHRGDETERLFSMLAEGNPEHISEQGAYEQALEQLREEREQRGEPVAARLPTRPMHRPPALELPTEGEMVVRSILFELPKPPRL
jgi:hypothetical protein